jgi:hypothetical protein
MGDPEWLYMAELAIRRICEVKPTSRRIVFESSAEDASEFKV